MRIHSSSRQRNGTGLATTDAVAGGSSVCLRERIGLLRHAHAARAENVELVARAFADARHEQLPDAGRVAQPHRMAPRVPGVEIADDGDALGIRRPDRKARSAHAVDRRHIGAERFGELEVPPFVEQVQVELAEHGPNE